MPREHGPDKSLSSSRDAEVTTPQAVKVVPKPWGEERWLAHTDLGFTREEIDRLILNGFESAFLPWPERRALLQRVKDELAGM